MRKNVLLCDKHPDVLAVERVIVTYLTRDKETRDLCPECLHEWDTGKGVGTPKKRAAKAKTTTRATARVRPKSTVKPTIQKTGGEPLPMRLAKVLRSDPQPVGELAKQLGEHHQVVASRLSTMVRQGKAERVGRGTYRTPDEPQPALL